MPGNPIALASDNQGSANLEGWPGRAKALPSEGKKSDICRVMNRKGAR
jgi:hypothetical protein